MEDLVRPELLEKIREKVKNISFDGIFDGGMVEQLLEENVWSPFPQFQHTERPDKAASGLLEGRIVLAVDNSPGVLILPATYQMFFRRETIITHDLKWHLLPEYYALLHHCLP